MALLSTKSEPEHATHAAVVERAGGSIKGWAECRAIELKILDLKKHVDWEGTTRDTLKKRETRMKAWEALWQLGYGGFNDSANQKVSVWSATVLAAGRE